MYHKNMTLRHRLFVSNIMIAFIAIVAMLVAGRCVFFFVYGTTKPDPELIAQFQEFYGHNSYTRSAIWFLGLAFFVVFINTVNGLFTRRITVHIIKSLEPINEGVRQINANNFAYRINYQNDDEFHPVCAAFNDMAAKLETSTIQLKKDEANRRELIAGISHDLRTPLTSIKGYLEGIETGVASTPEMQKKYLTIIKNKTSDLEHIIEQLFLFSKLDMDEFPLNIRRTDITLAISDMIEDSVSEYASRGLDIKPEPMPENVIVLADTLMLRNVIINIMENSTKYKNKEHGLLVIGAELKNNSIFLQFTDNGPGVKSEVLPNLFDVFYRTDPSRSKSSADEESYLSGAASCSKLNSFTSPGTAGRGGGSGLGLAISEKIIERMGGKMYAELPASGGLTIVIKLPILKEN